MFFKAFFKTLLKAFIKKRLNFTNLCGQLCVSFCLLVFCAPSISLAESVINSRQLSDFVDEMVTNHKFNGPELAKLLGHGELKTNIIDAMNKPAEGKPWYQYREIFIKPARVEGGVTFWKQNEDVLQRAEAKYGVPAEYIVAIIGVETRYGANTGSYRVLDALMTLAFNYPKRGKFFRKELEQYLLLTREEKIDPLSVKGSYAGAMGKPQFISSSYRHYAVDFDNDGKRDLLTNIEDVIGSVANYFSEHRWVPGQSVVSRVKVTGSKYKALLKQGLKPKTPIKRFSDFGVTVSDDIPDKLTGALIELELKTGQEYWVGLQNFYVITRYNRSQLYAMAVYQLSQQIRAKRMSGLAKNKSD
ncbi:MAG: lytic murein transglycosylase B [Gammaproteobacteria bacterium]|nr:lytic murein transglycosylase B [Gammaproteobacteria bacterium]